jgi:hypothetical protein
MHIKETSGWTLRAHTCHLKLPGKLRLGRSQFEVSSGKKVCKTPSQQKKLGIVARACHPSNNRKLKIGGSLSTPAWAKSKTLSPK